MMHQQEQPQHTLPPSDSKDHDAQPVVGNASFRSPGYLQASQLSVDLKYR
jgi:hypothetical protein